MMQPNAIIPIREPRYWSQLKKSETFGYFFDRKELPAVHVSEESKLRNYGKSAYELQGFTVVKLNESDKRLMELGKQIVQMVTNTEATDSKLEVYWNPIFNTMGLVKSVRKLKAKAVLEGAFWDDGRQQITPYSVNPKLRFSKDDIKKPFYQRLQSLCDECCPLLEAFVTKTICPGAVVDEPLLLTVIQSIECDPADPLRDQRLHADVVLGQNESLKPWAAVGLMAFQPTEIGIVPGSHCASSLIPREAKILTLQENEV